MEIIGGIIVVALVAIFCAIFLWGIYHRFFGVKKFYESCPRLVAEEHNLRMKRSDGKDIFEVRSVVKFSGTSLGSTYGDWWDTVIYCDFSEKEPIAAFIHGADGKLGDRTRILKVSNLISLDLEIENDKVVILKVAYKTDQPNPQLQYQRYYLNKRAAEGVRTIKWRLNEFAAMPK